MINSDVMNVQVDMFSKSLQDILNETGAFIAGKAVPYAITKGAKVSRDEWNKATEQFPTHRKDKPYKHSIHTSRTQSAHGMTATVKSKQYQLVHLLEKGHKTPAGTRTVKAYVHVKPAADKGIETTIETLKDAIKHKAIYE